MKKCNYCGHQSNDLMTECQHCGASKFENVCNNCLTVFGSGFCPQCGTRAGEEAKTCANCGTKSFHLYCPQCGESFKKNNIRNNFKQTIAVQEVPGCNQYVSDKKKGSFWAGVLIFFLPFIGTSIVLFGQNYKKGLQLFAIIWSLLFAIYCLFGEPESATLTNWVFGTLSLVPLVIYFVKILMKKRKSVKLP